MELDTTAFIQIDDALGFYQSTFVKVTKGLVSQGYMTKGQHEEIVKNKSERDNFHNIPFEQIKHYCHLELTGLAKALTILRDGFDLMPDNGIRLPSWSGAGAAASALIRKQTLKKNHYSSDIAIQNITPQQDHAHLAFVGGHIEPIMQGNALDRSLFLYDVASAYPAATQMLPSMKNGGWILHGSMSTNEIEETAKKANVLSMFKIKWNFPFIDPKANRPIPFYPFPYRTKRGAILFPKDGYAWIMRDELLAGLKWMKTFNIIPSCLKIGEWHEFIPGNDERPYAFVAKLYEMRRKAKTGEEYNINGKAIKLCLNSLYGKTAQRVGGGEDKAPSCVCPYYAAAITAYCRARVLEAAILDPYSIVCFMTDGIVSTRELKGLPRVKEVINGEAPTGTQIDLGDWEMERMGGGFFLQSGVYHIVHKNGDAKDKTRRADPRRFILKMELRDLMINRVLPEWKRNINHLEKPYTLKIEIRHYMTAGAAVASRERFKLIGRWSDTKRTIDIHTVGVKREAYEEPAFYLTTNKVSGPIDKNDTKVLKKLASLLDANERDVIACYRSGEALRCRFLVPWLPARNPTPDKLSQPCNPEWLDPDYDEGENPEPLTRSDGKLRDEDQDTAEIMIGS